MLAVMTTIQAVQRLRDAVRRQHKALATEPTYPHAGSLSVVSPLDAGA